MASRASGATAAHAEGRTNIRRLEAERRFARAMERGDEDRAADALDVLRGFDSGEVITLPQVATPAFVRLRTGSMPRTARVVIVTQAQRRRAR